MITDKDRAVAIYRAKQAGYAAVAYALATGLVSCAMLLQDPEKIDFTKHGVVEAAMTFVKMVISTAAQQVVKGGPIAIAGGIAVLFFFVKPPRNPAMVRRTDPPQVSLPKLLEEEKVQNGTSSSEICVKVDDDGDPL